MIRRAPLASHQWSTKWWPYHTLAWQDTGTTNGECHAKDYLQTAAVSIKLGQSSSLRFGSTHKDPETNSLKRKGGKIKMLRSMKDMQGYSLGALDGEIGRCNDFLFDDRAWVVRYIVADTRKWLPGRKVLLSPMAVGDASASTQRLNVVLTKDQIKASPPLDSDAPVSRRSLGHRFRIVGFCIGCGFQER
jgi:hypothetical protein